MATILSQNLKVKNGQLIVVKNEITSKSENQGNQAKEYIAVWVINEDNKSIDTMNPLNFLENSKPKEDSSISKPIEFTAIDESKYKMPDMVIKASEESALQESNIEVNNTESLNKASLVNDINNNVNDNINNNVESVQTNFDITKTMIQPVMSTPSQEKVSPQSQNVNNNVNNMSNLEVKTNSNTNLTNINSSINTTNVSEVVVNNNQNLNTNINTSTNSPNETINLQEANNSNDVNNSNQSNNYNNEFPSGSLLGDDNGNASDLLDINKQI